jgi:predicted lysophospholipase L1 biosynthesis ABC-type transport system permease subunit
MPMTNESVDVWTPSAFPGSVMSSRETRFYLAVARLRDGVSIDSARAELETIQGRLAAQYPATDLHWTPAIHPLKEVTVGHSRKGLWLLFGAVGLVLLIGCANVACLLLAQTPRRAREMAVRFSLGARRAQVIRQLLMEAFLVALPGAILGLVFCGWAIDFLRSIAHEQLPRADEIQLSWPVVLFTLSLSVATTFLFGLVPAWTASREDTAAALRQGSRGQVAGKQTILQVLVAGQVALAIVLLIGAGLLLRTMASLGSVPLGFKTRNVLTFRISAAWS